MLTVAAARPDDPGHASLAAAIGMETDVTETNNLAEDGASHPDHSDGRTAPELASEELKPGTLLLDGQYEILRFLNSGGFGITYLARDSLDRLAVIKECFPNAICHRVETMVKTRSRKHAAEFETTLQTFVDEARSLSRLAHPSVVGVHQVFEDNGTAYTVMDFIDGPDLHHIIDATEGAFSPAETVVILLHLLRAVEFIHQAGILHRDISPDNILIDPAGKPVLIDFGAASEPMIPGSRILTERLVIKDGYSPQELYLIGAEQTPASDLYALAATFYHVISGAAPPPSQRRLAALAVAAPDPCTPLARRFGGYPPGFLEAIDAAMRVLQRDRLQSAADWIALVQRGLAR